jgi:DNA-binding response OmpR family regulator
MIVDDSTSVHALLGFHLREESVELHSAYCGAEALGMIEEFQPDLVLLDVDLGGGMDGFEVCRQLRDNLFTMHTPVIFLTASSDTKEKVWGLELGAVDYVTKPFDPPELIARVRGALRAKSRVDRLSSRRVKEFMREPRVELTP